MANSGSKMTDTSERPLITIAVIAYNQEQFIRDAIEGAFAQTYQPLEIVLSDDSSPDRTFAIMTEMAETYDGPHKVVLNRNDPNLGFVQHIDRVMEIMSSQFLVMNAGDDVSIPERAEKLASIWLLSKRKTKLVHSAVRQMDAAGQLLGVRRPPERIRKNPTSATLIRDRGFVIGATAAWDREVFDRFGELGPGLFTEDRIIPFRATLLGGVGYVDENLLHHRLVGASAHEGQLTGWDYLFGISHRLRKWTAEVDRHILERFSETSYPDKDEIEAVCRAREPLFQFTVDLAEASFGKRLAMAPQAWRLAKAHATTGPLKDWLRYLFAWLYMPYASWKMRRKPAAFSKERVPEIFSK
jgi:hypothetical protein